MSAVFKQNKIGKKTINTCTGVARYFDWRSSKPKFDVFRWRNDDDVIIFLKFDFYIISLKKHNLTKSRNFRSPIRLTGAGDF